MNNKIYLSPEFELVKFDLESIMYNEVRDSFRETSGSGIDDDDTGE